jgi:ubiquinone/menaquinone biosynthesis C-methylase UbiE
MKMTDKQMNVFFEVHRNLPREGPGSLESTKKAFASLARRFSNPKILDIGCGPGAQTICLASISGGEVFPVDTHAPFIDELNRIIAEKNLLRVVHPTLADMTKLPFGDDSFDIIWAEGSIYIIGVEAGLKLWRPLLKRNGVIAFTEISWLRSDIPDELSQFWKDAYPSIASIEENIGMLESTGYRLLYHFILPNEDWWKEYYNPILKKLPILRTKYQGDTDALEVLLIEEKEMDLHRRYSDYYGYVFYVAEKQEK